MWPSRVCGVLLLGWVAGCASGGSSAADDDSRPDAHVFHDAREAQHDAPRSTIDASFIDASVAVDAFVRPDAPPGAFICSADGDCSAGECCFDFGSPPGFCVAGADFLGACVPSGS